MTDNTLHKKISTNENDQTANMQSYYKLHAAIYDLTRWSFLFGRIDLINRLPLEVPKPKILEVGCGTGYNLSRIAKRFPDAQMIGVDVSDDMIAKSTQNLSAYKDRLTLLKQPYMKGDKTFNNSLDCVVFSYSLTMINPQWADLILQAKEDLKPGGLIAVTDFHDSRFEWFKQHMGNNHVRMDGHLTPLLRDHFEPVIDEERSAYLGVWEYMIFVGRKK